MAWSTLMKSTHMVCLLGREGSSTPISMFIFLDSVLDVSRPLECLWRLYLWVLGSISECSLLSRSRISSRPIYMTHVRTRTGQRVSLAKAGKANPIGLIVVFVDCVTYIPSLFCVCINTLSIPGPVLKRFFCLSSSFSPFWLLLMFDGFPGCPG